MFDIGAGELLLIMIVVLIAFGPRKLPELAQSLGRGLREFKRAQREFTDQINSAFEQEQRRQTRTVNRNGTSPAYAPEQTLFPSQEPNAPEATILPPGFATGIPASEVLTGTAAETGTGANTSGAETASLPAESLPNETTIAEVPPAGTVQRSGTEQLGIFGGEGAPKDPA